MKVYRLQIYRSRIESKSYLVNLTVDFVKKNYFFQKLQTAYLTREILYLVLDVYFGILYVVLTQYPTVTCSEFDRIVR